MTGDDLMCFGHKFSHLSVLISWFHYPLNFPNCNQLQGDSLRNRGYQKKIIELNKYDWSYVKKHSGPQFSYIEVGISCFQNSCNFHKFGHTSRRCGGQKKYTERKKKKGFIDLAKLVGWLIGFEHWSLCGNRISFKPLLPSVPFH